MKKLINTANLMLSESLAGFAAAHADIVSLGAEHKFVRRRELQPGKVAMISGGDYRPRFQIEGLKIAYGTDARSTPTRAKAAAEKAMAMSAKATDLEKMYIASIAARRLQSEGSATRPCSR